MQPVTEEDGYWYLAPEIPVPGKSSGCFGCFKKYYTNADVYGMGMIAYEASFHFTVSSGPVTKLHPPHKFVGLDRVSTFL